MWMWCGCPREIHTISVHDFLIEMECLRLQNSVLYAVCDPQYKCHLTLMISLSLPKENVFGIILFIDNIEIAEDPKLRIQK